MPISFSVIVFAFIAEKDKRIKDITSPHNNRFLFFILIPPFIF